MFNYSLTVIAVLFLLLPVFVAPDDRGLASRLNSLMILLAMLIFQVLRIVAILEAG